jgi:hypothetical protein
MRVEVAALATLALALAASAAQAQDIEPRAYSNAPIGVNFLVSGYVLTQDGLAFDPSLPLKNPELTTSNAVVAYGRVLDFWGTSGKVDAIVPYTFLSGSADYFDERVEREVDGFGDSRFRLSVNLHGSPSLTLKEFARYRQELIVGASVQAWAPTGQYDPSRLVNIGTNRWAFKGEVGVSRAIQRWTLEAMVAANLFTDNPNFFGGSLRTQDPLYSAQGHVIYGFPSGIWAALDGTYFTGGRTTIDGTLNNDLQQNWRVGGTMTFPINRNHSARFYASSGVSARTGNNYDLLGLAWQYRWGGGL